jgi:hypothetical protein
MTSPLDTDGGFGIGMNVDRTLNVVRFSLTKDQKGEIIARWFPNLEEDRRAEALAMIEADIGLYQARKQQRSESVLPADVRDELVTICKAAFDLQTRLWRLEDRQPVDWTLSFNEERRILRALEHRLSLLANDIEPGKTGQPTRDVYILVQHLDGILREFTGQGIIHSRKRLTASEEFVRYVVGLADPDVTDGTIRKAMENAIKKRPTAEGSER